jgi:hypothetical protein
MLPRTSKGSPGLARSRCPRPFRPSNGASFPVGGCWLWLLLLLPPPFRFGSLGGRESILAGHRQPLQENQRKNQDKRG